MTSQAKTWLTTPMTAPPTSAFAVPGSGRSAVAVRDLCLILTGEQIDVVDGEGGFVVMALSLPRMLRKLGEQLS